MIIMINGAFGVGKTSVAEALQKTMENSMIFDPELVGFMLRNIVTPEIMEPKEDTGDFQDLELWPKLTVHVAEELTEKYNRTLIVPMTIYNKDYFRFIFDGFKQINKTYHFCLLADEQTIHNRLIERGETVGNWCFQQTSKCAEAFNDSIFEEFIDTEAKTISEIAHLIKNECT